MGKVWDILCNAGPVGGKESSIGTWGRQAGLHINMGGGTHDGD